MKVSNMPITSTVPTTASGMLRFGRFTSSPRVVADSKPVNQKMVYTTAIHRPDCPFKLWDQSNGAKELPEAPPSATTSNPTTSRITHSIESAISPVRRDGLTPTTAKPTLRQNSATAKICHGTEKPSAAVSPCTNEEKNPTWKPKTMKYESARTSPATNPVAGPKVSLR